LSVFLARLFDIVGYTTRSTLLHESSFSTFTTATSRIMHCARYLYGCQI